MSVRMIRDDSYAKEIILKTLAHVAKQLRDGDPIVVSMNIRGTSPRGCTELPTHTTDAVIRIGGLDLSITVRAVGNRDVDAIGRAQMKKTRKVRA